MFSPAHATLTDHTTLTARGRRALRLARTLALLLFGAAIGCVIALSLGSRASADTAGTVLPEDFGVVVVDEGESLWSIAAEVSQDTDTRDVVLDIAELNNLQHQVVHPGQELAVPAR